MSIWTDLREAVRQLILMQERVEHLTQSIEGAIDRLADHDRRIVRIETIIEVAQRSRLRSD
jgi:hypothetical protein